MNRFLKSRTFIGLTGAIIVGVFAVHEARGARAYLPAVGSPPLRFQAGTTNHLVFNLKSFEMPAKPAENPNALAQASAPDANATNIVVSTLIPVASVNTNQAAMQPPVVTAAKNNSVPPSNFGISPASASDLLTVTPQMITEYLKPAQNDANRADQPGVVTFVPGEMQFTPPPPKASGESQATYKIQ